MATFRSDYEKRKWDALQASSSASIKSIVEGKGTPADVQRVSNAMGQQSKLAREVFDEGVAAVEASAKAAVNALNERRVSKGKAPLTAEAFGKLFEDAFARQMKKEVPPLLQDIHDTLLIELYEQDDRFKSTLAAQFDQFRAHMGSGDVPSTDDLIALFDLNREIEVKQDEVLWRERSEGLLEKIADTFKETLREVAASVQAARQRHGQAASPSGMRLALQGPSGEWEVVDTDKAQSTPLLEGPAGQGHEPAATGSLMSTVSRFIPKLGGPASGAVTDAHSSTLPMVQLSEKADTAIITAAEQQTAFHERISDALDNQEREHEDEKEDDEEEQTGWFRKLRAYVGDSYKKATKSDNWWEAAAKTLLLAMTDPGLFDAISKKVQEIVTWDHVWGAVKGTFDWLWQKGNDMVEWVLGKIGLGTPKATDNTDSSRHDGGKGATLPLTNADRIAASNALTSDDSFKTGGTGGPTPENKDPNAHSSWQSTVNNFLEKNLGFRMDKSDAVNIGGSTGSTVSMGDSIMSASSAASSTTNKTNKTVSVQNGPNVAHKPIPATTPVQNGTAIEKQGGRPVAPSPSQKMGLGSIPTVSGIDDSLAITNLGLMF